MENGVSEAADAVTKEDVDYGRLERCILTAFQTMFSSHRDGRHSYEQALKNSIWAGKVLYNGIAEALPNDCLTTVVTESASDS